MSKSTAPRWESREWRKAWLRWAKIVLQIIALPVLVIHQILEYQRSADPSERLFVVVIWIVGFVIPILIFGALYVRSSIGSDPSGTKSDNDSTPIAS